MSRKKRRFKVGDIVLLHLPCYPVATDAVLIPCRVRRKPASALDVGYFLKPLGGAGGLFHAAEYKVYPAGNAQRILAEIRRLQQRQEFTLRLHGESLLWSIHRLRKHFEQLSPAHQSNVLTFCEDHPEQIATHRSRISWSRLHYQGTGLIRNYFAELKYPSPPEKT